MTTPTSNPGDEHAPKPASDPPDAELRALFELQARRNDEQARMIEQLLERLDRLEGQPVAAPSDVAAPAAPIAAASGLDAATSRRNLITKGAAAAATAVVGTAAVGLATASPAAAAAGAFDGNPAVTAIAAPLSGVAVRATSASGDAVLGLTDSGYAVRGFAGLPGGIGVVAVNTSPSSPAYGLFAESGGGTAIYANADSVTGTGLVSNSHRTQLQFKGVPLAPPQAGVTRFKGEMVFDRNSDLWFCVADGTPGTWRKVAGPDTAGAFHILPSTVRVYDSRAGNNPLGVTKGQIGNFAQRTIDAKIGGAVPAGASAVLVNLTIVNTTASGYLGLFKNGIAYPGNSTINWNAPNTLLANSAVVALDDQARFAVKANTGFTDFVIDAIGYYR